MAGAGAGLAFGLWDAALDVGKMGASYGFNSLLQHDQFVEAEEMAKKAYDRQVNYYTAFQSPAAMMRQYAEAGLSPSVMASNGVSGGSGINVGMGQAAGASVGSVPGSNTAVGQAALAQAELAHEQANALRGENKHGSAQIAQMLAEAGYKDAAASYTNAQTTWQNFQNDILDETLEEQKDTIRYMSRKLEKEIRKLNGEIAGKELENIFNASTLQDRIDQTHQSYLNMVEQGILLKAELDLKRSQIDQIKNAISQEWAKIDQTKEISDNTIQMFRDNLKQTLEQQYKIWGEQKTLGYWKMAVENIVDIGETALKAATGGNGGITINNNPTPTPR